MALTRIYRHIFRPGGEGSSYFRDIAGSSEGRHYLGAYELLKADLREVFAYVEPSEENKNTYSHRIFALLLRVCTEVETNAKHIAEKNGHDWRKPGDNIIRFSDLEGAMKLSEYEIRHTGSDFPRFFPFQAFAAQSRRDRNPNWYWAHNQAKHHRGSQFPHASLQNLIHAIGGLYVLLAAQFGPDFDRTRGRFSGGMSWGNDLFMIERQPAWNEAEQYDLTAWDQLPGEQKYQHHPLRKVP